MAKSIFTDPIVLNEIEHSRRRLIKSCILLRSSRSIIDASHEAIRRSRVLLRPFHNRIIDITEQPIVQNPFLAMDDGTINQMVADLAAAYVEARETGDAAGVDNLGKALEIIGRYLAAELGPRAAGVKLS